MLTFQQWLECRSCGCGACDNNQKTDQVALVKDGKLQQKKNRNVTQYQATIFNSKGQMTMAQRPKKQSKA
jgi:hypothetical protein